MCTMTEVAIATKRARFTRLQGGRVACQAGAISEIKLKADAGAIYKSLLGQGFKLIDKQGKTVYLSA